MKPGKQHGFSLMEVLVAILLMSILFTALTQIIQLAREVARGVYTHTLLNQESSRIFAMAADGGFREGNNQPGIQQDHAFDRVAGFHGRQTNPAGSDLLRDSDTPYRLTLHNSASGGFLRSQESRARSIPCLRPGYPMPDCQDTEARTVDGLAANAPWTTTLRSVQGRTPEWRFSLLDPSRLPDQSATSWPPGASFTTTYWTAFRLEVD